MGRIVRLDGIFVCPHKPEDDCNCRKPRTGLVVTAAAALGFNPSDSFLVGDKPCDVELGRRVGAATSHPERANGSEHENRNTAQADYVVDDVLGAAHIIAEIISAVPDIEAEATDDVVLKKKERVK